MNHVLASMVSSNPSCSHWMIGSRPGGNLPTLRLQSSIFISLAGLKLLRLDRLISRRACPASGLGASDCHMTDISGLQRLSCDAGSRHDLLMRLLCLRCSGSWR